jgi:hypothetical protein
MTVRMGSNRRGRKRSSTKRVSQRNIA